MGVNCIFGITSIYVLCSLFDSCEGIKLNTSLQKVVEIGAISGIIDKKSFLKQLGEEADLSPSPSCFENAF